MTTFSAHGWCLLWNPELILLHVLSNLTIAGAYFVIAMGLLTLRKKTDATSLLGRWGYRSFATFIFACGLTHIMDIIVLWQPWYYWQGLVLLATAVASTSTAVILASLVRDLVGASKKKAKSGVRFKLPSLPKLPPLPNLPLWPFLGRKSARQTAKAEESRAVGVDIAEKKVVSDGIEATAREDAADLLANPLPPFDPRPVAPHVFVESPDPEPVAPPLDPVEPEPEVIAALPAAVKKRAAAKKRVAANKPVKKSAAKKRSISVKKSPLPAAKRR